MTTTAHVQLFKRSRKQANGRTGKFWTLRWHDSQGRQVSESLGAVRDMPKREAKRLQAEKQTAIGSGRVNRDRLKRMTLTAFLDADHKAIAGDVRGSTLLEHGHAKAHAVNALGGDTLLSSLDAGSVGTLKRYLADLGRSPATVKKTVGTLRAAFNRAIELGYVHKNPFASARLPKVESKAMRIFTRAEVAALIEAAPDTWWRSFLQLAVTSGLRKDELLNLQWRDIDFDAGTVKVQPKAAETFEHAGRTLRTWQWHGKAKATYRTIPLPADTLAELAKLQLQQAGSPYAFLSVDRIRQIQRHIDSAGRVPAKYDLRPMLLRNFKSLQGDAAERLNARETWRIGCLHDLRRTFCTTMANHVPMHILREWSGHSDIATTAGFYLGMSDGMADRARAAWTAPASAG